MRHIVLELICAAIIFGAGMYWKGHLGATLTYACSDHTHVYLLTHPNYGDDE